MNTRIDEMNYLRWLIETANQEYKGDINLLLLEMNIKGEFSKWHMIQ